MTDDENIAYNLSTHCNGTQRGLNGSCYNSAYGFPYNSRNNSSTSSGNNIDRMGTLGTSNGDLVDEINTRISQTCKNAGITIYTIGLATDQAQQSTQAMVEKVLTECASTKTNAYFPKTPGELRAVFANIANELSALRLSQ
ncbi:MAG: hypothetical protein MO846_07830 [Candidatus Devosia symbiotica]|nr:hypothetical protein [Candidatus Devosia symbiotica]